MGKSKIDYVAVVDVGNSEIKAKNATREIYYRHAIYQLTENEYNQILSRSPKGHPDVYRVNGIPYAVGELAEGKGFRDRMYGSERYNELYYGTLLAIALFRLYEKSVNNIIVFASHPPKDVIYRPQIENSAKHKWIVEGQGESRTLSVGSVYKFDEPVGGVMNLIINKGGKTYKRSELKEGSTLVLDVGGYTIDAVALDDGQVDYTSAVSVPDSGIIQVEKRFINEFRSNNPVLLQSANKFSEKRVRQALTTGIFNLGGLGEKNCEEEAKVATSGILRTLRDLYSQFGGVTGNDQIVLTGGGCGLLYPRIQNMFMHPRLFLADDPEDLRFANVRGGMRMMEVYDSQGVL